ncbi:hypothetical protein N7495_002422 [Penicillium taxi]|uniref:uncharacterized protein n=1 Tax=Penicillium taxi TaxID=168475 RepID=UPI00254516A5|nr:uncharacterized protein N7495_002422 [Penicillium taxi]KAJ5901894.1 hypothetical protein N7495_002422 [Penicillium taxi]
MEGQQDTHEFWTELYTQLVEATRPLFRSDLRDIFMVLGVSMRQCQGSGACEGYACTKFELLSLDAEFHTHDKELPPYSITEAILNIFKTKTLEKFKCDKCGNPAVKLDRLGHPPEVLFVKLNRSQWIGGKPSKFTQRILLNEHIQLPAESFDPRLETLRKPIKYQLSSLQLHQGMEPDTGHYLSIVKGPRDTWTLCDDKVMTPYDSFKEMADSEDIQRQSYIVAYRRCPLKPNENDPIVARQIGQKHMFKGHVPSREAYSLIGTPIGDPVLEAVLPSDSTQKLGRFNRPSRVENQQIGNMMRNLTKFRFGLLDWNKDEADHILRKEWASITEHINILSGQVQQDVDEDATKSAAKVAILGAVEQIAVSDQIEKEMSDIYKAAELLEVVSVRNKALLHQASQILKATYILMKDNMANLGGATELDMSPGELQTIINKIENIRAKARDAAREVLSSMNLTSSEDPSEKVEETLQSSTTCGPAVSPERQIRVSEEIAEFCNALTFISKNRPLNHQEVMHTAKAIISVPSEYLGVTDEPLNEQDTRTAQKAATFNAGKLLVALVKQARKVPGAKEGSLTIKYSTKNGAKVALRATTMGRAVSPIDADTDKILDVIKLPETLDRGLLELRFTKWDGKVSINASMQGQLRNALPKKVTRASSIVHGKKILKAKAKACNGKKPTYKKAPMKAQKKAVK